MTTISAKEVVVTWDGDPSSWADYTRKVRLQWEKTPKHKRYLLGPELASRLTGRAWSVTPSLNHQELGKKNGTKYLLSFLRDRLCRTAVPDAGARLEDLLIRLRRPLGMSMAQWSNEVLEAYRKVQRALARARRQERDRRSGANVVSSKASKDGSPKSRSEPHEEPVSPGAGRVQSTSFGPTSPARSPTRPREPREDEEADQAEEHRSGQDEGDDYGAYEEYWTDEEWRLWYQMSRKKWNYDEDSEVSSGEDLPWEELEVENVEVLPEEVLGWLLLRRSNLSSANRLSVQASVQNSLSFEAIERALRDQEEELLAADLQRQHGKGRGHGRTFWVEENGQWGLLLQGEEAIEDMAGDIHWVGNQLPPEVYHQAGVDYNLDYDDEIMWCMENDGWHGYTQDNFGCWLETDGQGTFWSVDEEGWDREGLTADQNKELDEAYAVYENKARTFLQSRQFVKAKGASRGFYPMKSFKGKGKGKKGKKGKTSSSPSTSASSPSRPMFTAQEDVMMTASGSNNYSGCFICGDKGHGFRDCPKRAGQQPPPAKGHRKGTYWVESMTPTSLSSVFMLQPEDEKEIKNTDGWGVLDIGATETVASLEALERLLELRRQFHEPAADELRVVPHGRKPFRFGNGEVQHSESFVLLKQQVGERKVYLGLYTLMVSRVPILVGVKTLVKLGAVIDVKGQWMVLSAISPDLKIPLKRSVSGHLLVDLTKDWLDGSQPLFFSEDSMSARVYMVQAAAEDDDMQHEAVRFPGEDSSLCENLPVETSQHSEPPANMSCEVDADVVHGEDLQNEEDDNFTVMMATSNDDGACPVAQVDQQMRDRVLGALSRPSSSNLICHGAQDHQEGQPSAIDGALRLEPSMRPFGVGPTDSGASLQRRTCGSSDGSRQRQRGQQVRSMGRMPPLQFEAQLRANMGITRRSEEGWSATVGHPETAERQETSQGQCGTQGEEDHDGCSGALFGGSAQQGSSEEEGLHGEGSSEESDLVRLSPGERAPGTEGHFVRFESPCSEGGDEPNSGKEDTSSRRSSRRSGVSRSSSRHLRRRVGQGDQQVSLMTVAEEDEMEHEAAPPQHHDTMHDTTNLAFEIAEPEIFAERNSEEKVDVSEEFAASITKSEKYNSDGDVSILPKSPTMTGSPPGSEKSGRFNVFDENTKDLRKLDEECKDFLVNEMEKYQDEIEDLFTVLNINNREKPPTVMELCCEEDSGITTALEKIGGIGHRCGLFNGYDLLKADGFERAMQTLEVERPDALWVSFPCGPTSMIQELNRLTEEGIIKNDKKVKRSKRLVKRGIRLMMRQVELGGEVFQEWPLGNRAWTFSSIKDFWKKCNERGRYYEARADGCMYGLKFQGELMKKPWLIRATTKEVWSLHNVCQGNHIHVKCEGGNRTRLSALYPDLMCKRIAHLVRKVHNLKKALPEGHALAILPEEAEVNPDSLKSETHQELMRLSTELLRLHKKLGHPSRQVFVKMLRDRGADSKTLTLASQLHCMDCDEARVPPQRRATTIEGATQLWETVQLDNMEFTMGEITYHFQVMIDEASSYAAVGFLFQHHVQEGRNVSSPEMLESFHKCWIQYFGYPKILKLDREGAHRGREVEEWGESYGVEIQAIPAEAHGHIGKVERLIGSLKEKLLRHLRSSSQPPQVAAYAMVSAHNNLMKVGGYSPAQWVFGKGFSDSGRLHNEATDLPFWSSLGHEEKMQKMMENRLEAEHQHRLYMWQEKVNQANNTKMPPGEKFYPGDLIFYRRHQAPSDRRERSHLLLDVPRRNVARWYGPGRVLALETKVTYDGHVRQPHKVAWIIASGRLKRVTCGQLRHASEREKIVAEKTTPLTTPWTFTDLHLTINRGEYDEEIEEPLLRSQGPPKRMNRVRSASRGRAGQSKRASSATPSEPLPAPSRRTSQLDESMEGDLLEEFESEVPTNVPDSSGQESQQYLPTSPTGEQGDEPMERALPQLHGGSDAMEDEEVNRILDDQHYMPFSTPQSGPLFQHPVFAEARRRHQLEDRPYHVVRREREEAEQEQLWVETYYQGRAEPEVNALEDLIFAVTIPTPENEAEWRAIVKDPTRFVAKKVAKGVEVSWAKLNQHQRHAMMEAKNIEIKEWLASKVCKAAVGEVPAARLMKMRWVLVFKQTDDPSVVKAKARLVALGFTDPDVGQVNVKSPTLTRRSRQLLLQIASHKGWGLVKGDAKAALLQGGESQLRRQIFGMPVEELREAMNLEKGKAVQFLKAAYGLTIAPREFYLFVNDILEKLKMERLQTEPCLWRLRAIVNGQMRTIGLVGAHVDDFLMVGDETDSRWTKFLDEFHQSMRWSPWEVAPMNHCGIQMEQFSDGSWKLTQAEFCSGINQVVRSGKQKEISEEERHQCRAVLGAAQWRVYQTGPHHAAKLSHLQSMLPRGSAEVINDINKFVRELHGQRDLGLKIHQLAATSDEDLAVVAWCDASLANRIDLSSTGGTMIGFVHRDMVDKGVRGPVNLISWSSSRLKRVSRSSLAAETQAMAEAEQELMFIRAQWREMLGDTINLQQPEDVIKRIRGILVTDAKALFDAASNGEIQTSAFSMKEKYTALELLGLVQNMEKQGTELRWVNSDAQLADGMTKISAQDRIRKFLEEDQYWNLIHDEMFVAAKKRRLQHRPEESHGDDSEPRDQTWMQLLNASTNRGM